MLDRYPGASVHNIDRDAVALGVSEELCLRLEYTGMTFECEEVSSKESKTDWGGFEVVFLAALVGEDSGCKLGILKALVGRLTAGCVVVARSAQGLRSVLYPVGCPLSFLKEV
jgi:nicotianamine synthase